MKRLPVLLIIAAVAGCSRLPAQMDITNIRHVDSKGATEMPPKLEYAPGHTAGFSWDQTGLYGLLEGPVWPQSPGLADRGCNIIVTVHGKDPTAVTIPLPLSVWKVSVASAGREKTPIHPRAKRLAGGESGALEPIPQDQIRCELARWLWKRGENYSLRLWLSWKALGLEGAPTERASILVERIVAKEPRALFTIAPTAPGPR